MKKLSIAFVFGFVGFLGFVIAQANRGEKTAFYFRFVEAIPYGDKVGHFCLMGTLSFLVNWALQARRFTLGRFRPLLGSLIVFLLVALEEGSQYFLPNRTFSFVDLTADVVGIVVGGWVIAWWIGRGNQW